MRQHSYGVGQYRASEGHLFIGSRRYKPDATKRAIVVCPPRGQTASEASANGWAGAVLSALAEEGYPLLAIDGGGSTAHGNAASATAIGQAKTYAASAFGAKSDKIGLFATSMGSLAALRYAMDNPTLVSCACLGVPNLDLQDVHDVTRTDLASEIETAHGGAPGYATYLSAYNPASHAASFTTLPMQLHYASNDSNFTAGIASTFATATGAEAINLGAVGHTAATMDASRVVAFFLANLA